MKISLLHPSRGRPEKSLATIRSWIDRAGDIDLEIIVSIDTDDQPARYMQVYEGQKPDDGRMFVLIEDNKSAVDAINKAASRSTGDILIVVSDDTDCPENWGVDLLKFVEGKTDWIAKFTDGIQDWIITMPVMDRVYYNRFGYVYYPEYRHMFCDTELSCVADLTGRRITGGMVFPHRHYSTGAFAPDEVSKKADATWTQGENLFLRRARTLFGLDEISGIITNKEYILWARSKGVPL